MIVQGDRVTDLLTMYIFERWLARLSHSPDVNHFVLKGGMLLASLGAIPTAGQDDRCEGVAYILTVSGV